MAQIDDDIRAVDAVWRARATMLASLAIVLAIVVFGLHVLDRVILGALGV